MTSTPETIPPQRQPRPGHEGAMMPHPRDEMRSYRGSGRLEGRIALVTGGDSGIGRAVAIGLAKEGADVSIAYLCEHDDARHTASIVEEQGRSALLVATDMSTQDGCREAVDRTVERFGRLHVLVNNIAYQEPVQSFEELTPEQWDRTFRTNIHSYFWTTRAALPHLEKGASIVNTSSINGLRGNKSLIDYSATKGAINALTYSLAQALLDRGIRVNAVAPGPVWTPLVPSTMPEEKTDQFGGQVPMQRAAEPDEIAPSFIFFACNELSSYYTGEVLAPIGGETMPG